jgi:hypothetical protein
MWTQGDGRVFRILLALSLTVCLGAGFLVQPTAAQSFGFDSFSPLVWFPSLEGEVKVRPIAVHIGSGTLSGTPNPTDGGSLRDTFYLNQSELFADTMVRLQLSRLSIRGAYAPRDFAAFGPRGPREARLSYTGIVVGMDFDVIQWNRTRLGLDVDYDLFAPRFTYPIPGNMSARISGGNAITVGFHATYNPLRTLWGLSGIAEVRARWPISDTQVTDWEIAAGFASPTTVIGSWSLMAGYRNTRLSFKEDRGQARPLFDGTFEGWFGELVYYY